MSREWEGYERTYSAIFQSNIEHIKRNSVAVDPLPKAGEMRWGMSAVLRGTFKAFG